jgi:type II secretion system protein N
VRLPFQLKLPKKVPLWQRATGYTLFGLLAFILFLFLTFPHQAFWGRVKDAAAMGGYYLRVDDYGGGPSGLTGYGVKLAKAVQEGSDTPQPALELDSLSLRPTLLPPGLAFKVKAFGGKISGTVDGFSLLKLGRPPPANRVDVAGQALVQVDMDHVDLSKGNLKAFSGIDLAGVLDGRVDLKVPVTGLPGAPAYALDPGGASGTVTLNGGNLAINGGSVTVPMMGDSIPMDLPKVNLGKLDALLKFDKGVGTIDTLKAKSDEVDIQASGTLKLARKIEYSEPAVDLKLKLEQPLMTRLGAVAAGLSILPPDRQDPTFRVARWSGYLNRPRFGPARQ